MCIHFWTWLVTRSYIKNLFRFFCTGTGTKICFWSDRDLKLFPAGTGTKIFFSSGPGPEFFLRLNRDQNFFLAGIGTKNNWSRSCLSHNLMSRYQLPSSFNISRNNHVFRLKLLRQSNNSETYLWTKFQAKAASHDCLPDSLSMAENSTKLP
jgi:hypothetical protein